MLSLPACFFFFFFGMKLTCSSECCSFGCCESCQLNCSVEQTVEMLVWVLEKKRRVSSNQVPELFVCCVKAIRPVAVWWKSCESRQWGPKRAKMSEVLNAALMHGGGWKMTTNSTSKMLSPNLTVWRKMFQSFCLSGLNMKDVRVCVC